MQNMTIKIKSVGLDSLTQATFNNSGFTAVYAQNTLFTTLGWNSLQLTTPFNWDGVSNLLIEITYDNTIAGADNIVASTNTTYNSGLLNFSNGIK